MGSIKTTRSFATETTLAEVKAKIDNLDTALSGIKTGTDKIPTDPVTSGEQENLLLKLILGIQALLKPAWFDASLNRLRGTGIIESGTVTTVTTVTTVAGLTNIDGYQGKLLMINQNMSAWVLACRNRIT